ncbi:MAG: hypothetical protein HOC20_11515 [Chloroflexi bacterium]|jgi:hypothetical protein|nr:hypothetical protein [Chloroflexota bacterium]
MAEMPEFYKRKLLLPGWPGEVNKEEHAYIKKNLQHNPRLRTRWGFTRGNARLSKAQIIHVARFGTGR